MTAMSRPVVACALVLAALVAPLAARGAPDTDPRRELERTRADVVATARDYRDTLVRLRAFREDAVRRAESTLATRRSLLESGIVARREVETAEAALGAANFALARTEQDIADAERLVAEAEAVEHVPPAAIGETTVSPTLLSHHGPAAWSLARVDTVRRFFSERFGRPLPISALGQTAVHDRLGFDHRNALDVAVHPDSVEGKALIVWLRGQGVSFLAFRGPVVGESTGAHVHIGEPSPRRAG
jgi:hypothetical protein